ncbi:MAG TPA: EamA family transporter [Candidatus Limnocylindrales bacterium]|nr:EamA family transporter [Candidatus Limnocylindrales bacterium]
MPTRRYATGLPVWLALGTVYLVWGSTYLGIAVAIESIPPFVMLAIRFVVAGSLLVAWDWLRNRGAFAWPTRREIRDSAIVGALLLGIGNGFVAFGEQTVASGIAALLVAMMPLWLAVFGWLYFRERLTRLAILGVVVGLGGVALLVWPIGAGANAFDGLGIAVLVVSPIAWSHGSLFSAHRARLPRSGLMASGLQMLAGAAVLVVEGLLTGEFGRLHPEAVSARSLVALAYLAVVGSMVAFTAYAWLLRHAPLPLVGTYAYVNPVVAVGLGSTFLAEPISARTLVASAIIVAAVAMIVTARSRMAGGRPEEIAPGAIEEPATVVPAVEVPSMVRGAAARRFSRIVPRRAPSD